MDSEIRLSFVDNIDGIMNLTESQTLLVDTFMHLETEFNDPNGPTAIKVKSTSPFVEMSVKKVAGRSVATGKAVATIDTSPAYYIASIWDHCGNEK